jgi:hypothetical protein
MPGNKCYNGIILELICKEDFIKLKKEVTRRIISQSLKKKEYERTRLIL